MHINELINPASLRHDLDQGFIRVQTHPTLPLRIYNYTEKAQFSKHWNKATLTCRGLIVDNDGRVVARPFPKFFNWDEQPPKGRRFKMDLDEPAVVTDKMDGSLGILYRKPLVAQEQSSGNRPTEISGEYAIATRGSFTSDQAIHATKIWEAKYAWGFEYRMNPGLTYLFEIVYPENRIVVDYKGLDDLVLIGAVDTEGGFIYGPEMLPGWPGPRAQVFLYETLREAVQAKPRAGKEGFVVRSLSDNLMVKIKQEDYVRLHRIVTGLNEKEVWRRLREGEELLADIPDELHDWVVGVAKPLRNRHVGTLLEVQRLVDLWFKTSDPGSERKDFAEYLETCNPPAWLRSAAWLEYDGNDIKLRDFLWKQLEPKGDVKK